MGHRKLLDENDRCTAAAVWIADEATLTSSFEQPVVPEILGDSQRPCFSEDVVIANVDQCLAAESLDDSQRPELDVERGGTTDSNDSPPYLRTPCRRPTGDVALNSPGERAAEPGMAAPFIQVSPTFNNTFLRCAAAARWNGSKKKLNSDRRHSLCNSDKEHYD